MPFLAGPQRLGAKRHTGQEKEQRHVDGIEDFREQGRIPRKLTVGRGVPEYDHEDSNAFCDIYDLDPSFDLFFEHHYTLSRL